jgi:hypothetical protein
MSSKLQATSNKQSMKLYPTTTLKKLQAASDKRLSKKRIKIHEAWAFNNGYRDQATCDKLSRDKMTQGR